MHYVLRTAYCVILALAFFGLTACGPANPTADLYRPPTPVNAPLATEQAASYFNATPAPPCSGNLYFLEDLTVPDGTLVTPGEVIDKQWQVENNGTCNWDERYRLRLIAGPAMGAPAEQALFPARSGAQAVIRILFTAPAEAGEYLSEWQAYAPDGTPFGEMFFIKIIVE